MQNTTSTTNPYFSIIIPTFNAEKFIERAVGSLMSQTYSDFEVVVVDDASCDSTVEILQKLVKKDQRVGYFVQEENSGTLATRARGVAEAKGEYILLLDQDDELKPETFEKIHKELDENPVDILHFGVEVVAESEGAKKAAIDCENWLTPKPRRLFGEEILATQFCDENNFDWHVHHRVFKSELAKKAWGTVLDDLSEKFLDDEEEAVLRLSTSDDFLMSYVLCSLANTYVALPDSKWYVYHLGAGETFAQEYTFEKWKRICDADAKAFWLINGFEKTNDGSHKQIIQNCQNKLIEHVMNEMHDNLSGKDVDSCIDYALKCWCADAVAGELWRFVRDRAYNDIVNCVDSKNDEILITLTKQADYADSFVRKFDSVRYSEMKKIANAHLDELKGSSPCVGGPSPVAKGPSPLRGPSPFARIKEALRKG